MPILSSKFLQRHNDGLTFVTVSKKWNSVMELNLTNCKKLKIPFLWIKHIEVHSDDIELGFSKNSDYFSILECKSSATYLEKFFFRSIEFLDYESWFLRIDSDELLSQKSLSAIKGGILELNSKYVYRIRRLWIKKQDDCFFYSNNAKIGKELIDIAITNKLETNIEEFALYIWANCNLAEWIMEYEPLVCIGQFNDELKEVSFALNEINNYISLFLNKKVYFIHKNKIKIIRALWGDSLYILNEIPKTPIFENELVFVWGKANYDFVKKLGYEALLISETKTQGETYDSHLKHFGHKLQALKFADEMFGEYLFLDWDVTLVKQIDDEFYNKKGNITIIS
jgi:hypothetical protein